MTSFFKAWVAYSGILVKLAPYGLQGELATALSIYTMNLYELLEKYSWDGVRSYHFQFHRKRVASGKNIYQPAEWRTLDSELVASKCFAYPASRVPWTQSQRQAPSVQRRPYELPIREIIPSQAYSHQAQTSIHPYRALDQHATNHYTGHMPSGAAASTGAQYPVIQACRNWNYRECRSTHCRHQHACLNCGSNHKAPQCNSGNNAVTTFPRGGLHGR